MRQLVVCNNCGLRWVLAYSSGSDCVEDWETHIVCPTCHSNWYSPCSLKGYDAEGNKESLDKVETGVTKTEVTKIENAHKKAGDSELVFWGNWGEGYNDQGGERCSY